MSGTFIDTFLEYFNMRTNSPKIYGTHLAIQMLGHAMGNNTVCLMQPSAVNHNIYLALIGQSGKAMKTTAQQEIVAPLYPNEVVGDNSFSPEGLLRALQENPHLICHLGEFSQLLGGMKRGGYMSNLKEISNEIFSCPSTYKKRLTDKKKIIFY